MMVLLFIIGVAFVIYKIWGEVAPPKHKYNNMELLLKDRMEGKSTKETYKLMKKGRYDKGPTRKVGK